MTVYLWALSFSQITPQNDDIQEILDTIKHTNIWIIGIPESEEYDYSIENLSHEILEESFPNLEKHSDIRSNKYKGTQME